MHRSQRRVGYFVIDRIGMLLQIPAYRFGQRLIFEFLDNKSGYILHYLCVYM